nr:MAG TPA: hypothetical protein [Caudoviricetes sp.]
MPSIPPVKNTLLLSFISFGVLSSLFIVDSYSYISSSSCSIY